MNHTRIALTHCKDGFIVSTVGLIGLGQTGGDYETAIWHETGDAIEDVERYETPAGAIEGHARYVAQHGGRSLRDRLFQHDR